MCIILETAGSVSLSPLDKKERIMSQDNHFLLSALSDTKRPSSKVWATAFGAFMAVAMLAGCIDSGDQRPGYTYRQYDHNRPDPAYGGYDAGRYYRDDARYRERQMNRNDRVYRGNDGRYYCRRNDGTTGLIIGAIAGGILGNVIAPGDSKTLGTALGAGGGAVIGRSIGRNSTRCR
jgi:Glycine zipper 2TM domain